MRRDYLNIFDAVFRRVFSPTLTHNEPDACLSLSSSRDSALFITRFINLNANWFHEGLSMWGPNSCLTPLIVSVCVLCTCWCPEWHGLTARASPACLSAWSVALIRLEGFQPRKQEQLWGKKKEEKYGKKMEAVKRWESQQRGVYKVCEGERKKKDTVADVVHNSSWKSVWGRVVKGGGAVKWSAPGC